MRNTRIGIVTKYQGAKPLQENRKHLGQRLLHLTGLAKTGIDIYVILTFRDSNGPECGGAAIVGDRQEMTNAKRNVLQRGLPNEWRSPELPHG